MSSVSRSRYRARRVRVLAAVVIVIVVVVIVLTSGSSPTAGYDISYPQCSASYPSSPVFGIVGVNGGLPTKANPCLSDELHWARGAPGQKRPPQTSLSLYLDTGNPGDQVSRWPKSGKTRAYGSCNGLLTDSCSYLYGEQRAVYSYRLAAALDAVTAKTAPWWLDVELTLSWAATYQLNIAALQGYVAGLNEAGATGPIGVYSTSEQWKEITGLTAQTTSPVFRAPLSDWVAGTETTLSQARQDCTSGGFTGVAPNLAQYRIGSYDADLRCPVTP